MKISHHITMFFVFCDNRENVIEFLLEHSALYLRIHSRRLMHGPSRLAFASCGHGPRFLWAKARLMFELANSFSLVKDIRLSVNKLSSCYELWKLKQFIFTL